MFSLTMSTVNSVVINYPQKADSYNLRQEVFWS